MKKSLLSFLVVSFLVLATSAVAQNVANVEHPGTGPYATIQAAVDAATPGDTITVMQDRLLLLMQLLMAQHRMETSLLLTQVPTRQTRL